VNSTANNIYLALVHYPIYDRNQEIVSTSITNLDIHDFSRLARTYNLGGVFLVSPVTEQKELVERIIFHWQDGFGAEYNAHRAEALTITSVVCDLAEAEAKIMERHQKSPLRLSTSARFFGDDIITPEEVLEKAEKTPVLVIFGTGYGLAEGVIAACDGKIQGIAGGGEYNHLSVRSAASILVDRIFTKKSK
jgi:tRNA (guanine37-N1)-methyltransferase